MLCCMCSLQCLGNFWNGRWLKLFKSNVGQGMWKEVCRWLDCLSIFNCGTSYKISCWPQPKTYTVGGLRALGFSHPDQCIRLSLMGRSLFESWRRIWKSWAPAKCKVFLWLAVRNRCWTADQLAKRNLPHLSLCPLCDQAEETIQHLLTSCVFAREFWFRILSPVGFQRCVPDNRDQDFAGWWRKAAKQVPKEKTKVSKLWSS